MKQPLQYNPLLCCHILAQYFGNTHCYSKILHTHAALSDVDLNRIGTCSSYCMCGEQKGGYAAGVIGDVFVDTGIHLNMITATKSKQQTSVCAAMFQPDRSRNLKTRKVLLKSL